MATAYSETELQRLILEFNNNPENQELIDYYTSKTFFEILSIPRRETVHSSFIAWILEGKDFSTGILDSPVMGLLDIISEKRLNNSLTNESDSTVKDTESENSDNEKKTYKFPDELLKKVLSRSVTVTIDSVTTEDTSSGTEERPDIVLKCIIKNIDGSDEKLLIVIENKVYSKEGDTQTNRYFDKYNNNDNYPQEHKIFIYLTPDGAKEAECEHFVHITYQDIMDRILDPLSKSSKLSDKARVLIQDYIKTLSVPAFTEDKKKPKKYSVLAVGKDEKKKLIKFADTNSSLIEQIKNGKDNKNDFAISFKGNYKQLFMAATDILNTCSDIDNDINNNIISNLNDLYGSESESSTFNVTITENGATTSSVLGMMPAVKLIVSTLYQHDPNNIIAAQGLINTGTKVIKQTHEGSSRTYKQIKLLDGTTSDFYVYTQWRPENFNPGFVFNDGNILIKVTPQD